MEYQVVVEERYEKGFGQYDGAKYAKVLGTYTDKVLAERLAAHKGGYVLEIEGGADEPDLFTVEGVTAWLEELLEADLLAEEIHEQAEVALGTSRRLIPVRL